MSALSILSEECELLNDSKYRAYITQVEKALKNFDSTSEWADLISALGKLNKVLLSHVKYPVIPKRVTIGKRLAQCLHPALPSGVHLKALETYDIIFKCIGTQRLAQDLFIYSAGLFPLLSHSAMNVKPVLLMIYERHFVSLGKRIKPGLNGLLLGLLPGLEEGSEFYDQTNNLLEDFCEATDPAYFYTCLWECVHSCPSVRLPAVMYLMTHYNKKQTMEDQLYMIGLNINLMVEGICHAVQDTSVLVQRSLLDFLTVAFPLHNSQLTHSDMAKIVKASINILMRRDMSLNRRFYAWLLGTGTHIISHPSIGESKSKGDKSADSETELSYFEKYSKDLLVQALKHKLTEKSDVTDKEKKKSVLRPFRILISLLDKPEIGPVILENVLLSIFRCLHREFESSKSFKISAQAQKKDLSTDTLSAYDELLKTANLLFGTFEPYFIWDFTARMFEQACFLSGSKSHRRLSRQASRLSRQGSWLDLPDQASVTELCQLVTFLLDILSLETFIETQTEHLPQLLCRIIGSLTNHCGVLSDAEIIVSLKLCTKLLSKVQPTMTTPHDQISQRVEVSAKIDNKKQDNTDTLSLEEAIEMNKKLKDGGVGFVNTIEGLSAVGLSGLHDARKTSSDSNCDMKIDGPNQTETVENKQGINANSDNTAESVMAKVGNSSKNLMQSCIDCFQNFFHTLVNHKLVQDLELVKKCVESLILRSEEFSKPFVTNSETVLSDGGDADENKEQSAENTSNDKLKISLGYVDDKCLETFTSACQLMVEFASFPMYSSDSHDQYTCRQQAQGSLPVWIQDLIISGCFIDNFTVQSSAISTMIDLIILTQSVQVEKSGGTDTGNQMTENQPRSLVILPTLHPDHLRFLNEETEFYKAVASILWQYMDETTPGCHQQAVKLFNILHQVAPSSWICEDVIGRGLVADYEVERLSSMKKFMVLWHLTRNKTAGVIPGKPLRTFDRSMFVVLDSLREESSSVKTLATTWLTHVIQHGDISRVMEPLLLMLLHPDTARVSIQHVNIHKPRKVHLSESSEDDTEANIYAISSEGGNIIYHVSMAKNETKKHSREELKSYALTVLNDRGAKTAPVRTRSEQELHFERVNPSDLMLRINPFGSESSLDKLIFDGYDFPPTAQPHNILNKAKRLDKQTCAKEGISFTGSHLESSQEEIIDDEQKGEHSSQPDSDDNATAVDRDSENDTVEEIVQKILEDILCSVTETQNDKDLKENDKKRPPKLSVRSESANSSILGEQELLNSVNKQGCQIDSPTASELDLSLGQVKPEAMDDRTNIHPLHMHLLLYTQKYDYYRTLYALSTLKSMLEACPRLFVSSLVTTSISALRTPQLAKLQLLLARHRKSVFGKNFFGEIPPEVMSNYRSSMFIEILISVCLYFIRGYYPNLMMSKMNPEELLGNKQVHIMATETLTLMMSQVIVIMRDSGRNFVSYISDLLSRCKVQKALLHCVLATIYNCRKRKDKDLISSKITEAIIAFNEENLVPSANETFQVQLLNLLLSMIILEEQIIKIRGVSEAAQQSDWDRLRVNYQPSLQNVRYIQGHLLIQQGMFMSSVLSSLKQFHLCHMHRHWIALVTGALPYMGKHLPGIVISVVSQLCRNLEAVASEYESSGGTSNNQTALEKIPPDYAVTLLDSLMNLCHYCLLDVVSPVSIGQPSASGPASDITTPTNIFTNLWHVFNPVGNNRENSPARDLGTVSPVLDARSNLLSVLPRIIACMASLWRAMKVVEKHEESPSLVMGAPKIVRQYILEFLSPISLPHGTHLLGAIAVAWNDRRNKNAAKNMKRVVPVPCEDQLLLVDLISAVKVLPMDTLVQTVKQVIKQPPLSELARGKKNVPLEVNMLQFFYAYVRKTSQSQLLDSWPALLSLLKESLQLSLVPQGQFLLLLILNEFVQKTPSMADKKNQKEVQEISQRLLEAISTIAGSSLEQTTWLRKNYAVKPGPQSEETEHDDSHQDEDLEVGVEKRVSEPEPTLKAPTIDSKYSVQALSLLAEITAPILDVVYTSEEKDKVPPFLGTLLYNIFPYLKHHSANNLPSLRASSQFLSSISSYQYTRKAWRKEALDMMLDPSFFQMDSACIGYWHSVVDNLMTHDKTTFKDLMSRVSIAQTTTLNIFSSREQEIDQKAAMLKRLAFTIFCSEPDQYQKSTPEIQERLAESLRVPQAPSVMAQVFLCFRVLILRVSPQHLTSMWPTIITELIHVFLQIEQELSTETEEFVTQVQRIAALDSSWAHLGNGLNAHNNPSWLQLYLSACKLLDLCLALPAERVPQFQLYRWAFIGGAAAGEVEDDLDLQDDEVQRSHEQKQGSRLQEQRQRQRSRQISFKPHIIRLAKLLNSKLRGDVPVMKLTPGRPLLTLSHLRSLTELQPFFNTLCLANQTDNLLMAAQQLGGNTSWNQSQSLTNGHSEAGGSDQLESKGTQGGKKMPKSKSMPGFDMTTIPQVDLGMGLQTKSNKQYIEDLLERDFLEPMS